VNEGQMRGGPGRSCALGYERGLAGAQDGTRLLKKRKKLDFVRGRGETTKATKRVGEEKANTENYRKRRGRGSSDSEEGRKLCSSNKKAHQKIQAARQKRKKKFELQISRWV